MERSFANLLLLALGATLGFLRRDMNRSGGSVGFKFALRADILGHLRCFVFVLVLILIGDTALREEKSSLLLVGVCKAIIITWRWDHGVRIDTNQEAMNMRLTTGNLENTTLSGTELDT